MNSGVAMTVAEAFPPSFGESPLLYTWALGSITALAALMASIAGWMVRDLWRDRFVVHPRTGLSVFRFIILFASITSFLRALPEAIYMYAWNEVSAPSMDLILTFKRLADGLAIAPGAIWTCALVLAYPSIAHQLKSHSYSQTDLSGSWPRLARPAAGLALIFAIAFLVAISKLYLGVGIKG